MSAKKILIVDDEKLVGIALIKELEEDGYEVESVTSGEAALEKIRKMTYDLIFVDLVMPGMNGAETCQKIKELSPDTEIVCFTGTYDKHIIERQMDFVAAGGRLYFLYKPFREGYIKKAVQKALAGK
ncbi:MAG TPA: response regulator [Candidatus Omnitrophota bacterium]|nr:response regulator [Candidatus Omnitrophota bacterium]